ncbi:hypothetical protein I7I51_02195 [Histoplasma capsulatum]|uniref:Uncharacterized protein n=1 Tax=Ajellomyces capsulatus TaxID=5037 RepID=A0A8A1M7H5_AJECA|nr:hypothetical protein I7I51_02195 [Histoplasma capsulatum]
MSTQITPQKRRESEPNLLAEIAESSSKKLSQWVILSITIIISSIIVLLLDIKNPQKTVPASSVRLPVLLSRLKQRRLLPTSKRSMQRLPLDFRIHLSQLVTGIFDYVLGYDSQLYLLPNVLKF